MGGPKLIWSSFWILLFASSCNVVACSDKGICLLEALAELKECKKAFLATLLKPLLATKLLEKEKKLPLPPLPPPTIVLMPAAPPAPPCLPPPCQPPPFMLAPPPPPLCLPAPPPPPILIPAPPPAPLCLPPPAPFFLPAPPPPPLMLAAPPPAPYMLAPPPAPLCLPAPPPLPLPPALPPASPIVISLVPPPPPPCLPPPPPGLPMTAYMVPPPVKLELFSLQYKWLIAEALPHSMGNVRYDADITFVHYEQNHSSLSNNTITERNVDAVYFQDVFVHPFEGASVHPWAYWSKNSLILTHDRDRILRRYNLKGYPLKIATPIGIYSKDTYHGSFSQYLADERLSQMDSGIRSGHGGSSLIIDRLSATNVLVPTLLWSTELHNDSMLVKLESGDAELAGGILRILLNRIDRIDYILPIWPFRVGFTYLAERESSSNMFVEPFAEAVWWTCLGIGIILIIAQRLTSRSRMEKDGACFTVLATCLQQDASAVPEGIAGRWTFTVLSISSMLVHAYYTSAIVSSLMSTGRTGPDSLRSLADSRYAIASEDYDYMRYLMFDVKTNWDDLEYLKKMKMTPKFYQTIERGVELIRQGDTAFHTEFNQLFPYFKTLTSDQLCKLQYLDTVPETMSWITTTKNGQWTNIFKSTSDWILEVGLAKRLVSRLRAPRPECREALLAERVKFGDVAPLMMLTVCSVVLSLILLGLEVAFARWKRGKVGNPEDLADKEKVDEEVDVENIENLSQYNQY